jgi:predicted nucleic acid-binding protein
LAGRYYEALSSGPNWQVRELTAEISFLAARIRIRYHLKLPDAIQIATAIQTGSSALITHDRDFYGVDEIKIIGI